MFFRCTYLTPPLCEECEDGLILFVLVIFEIFVLLDLPNADLSSSESPPSIDYEKLKNLPDQRPSTSGKYEYI